MEDTGASGPGTSPRATEWWTPGRADWQVAALFAVGASCFALGALPGYAALVGATADGVTYAVGSVFFTAAALLQFLVSIGVIRADERPRAGAHWRTRVRSVERPEWWSGMVQFVGTVLFNISTFAALDTTLSSVEDRRRVWAPNLLGSVAFLVASTLAFAGVRRPWWSWRPRELAWSITWLNMLGSVAFGVSAVAARLVPGGTDVHNAALMNLGTFVGAICFLVAAVLLIPDEQEATLTEGGAQAGPG